MNKFCIIGNSVATSRTPAEGPLAGWGQYLADFLDGRYELKNYARDAMTARSYYTERFITLLNTLGPGDVVAIDFGAVEQRINVPLRYHSPREFTEFLKLYVAAISGEGAVPVLVTPTARCTFDVHGGVVDSHDGYPELVREVAAATGAPLVDLNHFTTRMLQELGPTRARGFYRWTDAGEHPNHPDGIVDSTHFNEAGAREVARIFASVLHRLPGLPPGLVAPDALQQQGVYPPVQPEFTVSHPESALFGGSPVTGPPTIKSPSASRTVSPLHKFSGEAPPGTSYLLFFEGNTYVGGTSVNSEGRWLWRRTVNWPGGEHHLQAVGIVDSGVTAVAGVSFTVRDHVEPPVVLGPREGAWSGPRPRFSGTAAPDVSKVMVLEGGRLIGEAPVREDGTWSVRHPHDWRPGRYVVEFVSVFSALHSRPTPLSLRIHGVPEGNWIRTSAASREPCGDKCEHLPFAGTW
ncbi:GDSL-type esterase/lipase family protein [Streptomyces sp. NPDC005930]|uniref:GDSL-type esterase/lipase family protein n=1 Tax=Streptomyces sp. NPDC005930 TaxID=3364736 RepID=UPI0036CBFB7E